MTGFGIISVEAELVIVFGSVKNSSTTDLMSKFHKKIYQEKLKPAATLIAAQLEI